MTGVDTAERTARLRLALVIEPGLYRLGREIATYGAVAVEEALRRGDPRLDPSGAVQRRLAALDERRRAEQAFAAGLRFVCPGDPEWPEGLDALAVCDPRESLGERPIGLWLRGSGHLGDLLHRSVAVVGARAASGYGLHVAGELSADLSEQGITVVSGAAYGIDAAAHRGALAVGRPTVAVLACGADVAYPRGNSSLIERIAGEGVVVSECPPGATVARGRFLSRNRIIAAMTSGTVVVEAALRSGALNTAGWANALFHPVMAVPGPVTSALSEGCHQLVREGAAELVTSASDVLAAVSPIGEHLPAPVRGAERPWDQLPTPVGDVLDSLPAQAPVSEDWVAEAVGITAKDCRAALAQLARLGLAEQVSGGWRIGPRMREANRASS